MSDTKELTGTFIANAVEHEEKINQRGFDLYLMWRKAGMWDGSDWFEYQFPDGTHSDVEVWAWDDGDIRVTAYRQYVDDDGFNATDMSCFHPCGVIDHDPSFIYNSGGVA